MARKAREKSLYSVYLIEQGCGSNDVFTCQSDANAFVESLINAQKQYGFLLLAAEMVSCSYRLLIFDNGSDISMIMRSINIGYALYIKRQSSKFKERFKSQIIRSKDELIQVVKTFSLLDEKSMDILTQSNACVNSSGFRDRYFREGFDEFLNLEGLLLPCWGSHCHRSQDILDCMVTAEACRDFLEEQLSHHGLTMGTLSSNKTLRDALILNIRQQSNLTLKQIGELFGGMSESAISKIIKRRT